MLGPDRPEWWQWPLRHELTSGDIPKYGEDAIRRSLYEAVATNRMPIPAMDCLPDAERRCREALTELQLKLGASSPWYTILPTRSFRRPGGIVSVHARDRILYDIQYVGRDLRERPSTFATESARFRARLSECPQTSWDVWTKDPYRVVRSTLRNHLGVVSTQTLNREMFWKGGRVPSICPVLMATVYHVLRSRRVLDLSAGWGDRLSAALALPQVEEYLGIDPNPALVPGMERLVRQASSLGKDPARFRVETRAAETAETAESESTTPNFDTMLTSPPFWDKELYDVDTATNGSQSVVRHPTLDEWLGSFWPRYCESGIRRLRPGGYFVLHMHDVSKCVDSWVDRARQWLDAHPRLQFLGVMAVREYHVSFVEPLWVWAVRELHPI